MKRIPLTSEIEAKIKLAVGDDVDCSKFAIFETIALNELPLPGKSGSIFDKAVTSVMTLQSMAQSINSGNSLPLMHEHDMKGMPMGRVFYAETMYADEGHFELRALFYIDETNEDVALKIDAASLDEVSVQFLAEKILCSECGWDFRGEDATWLNFMDATCGNDHAVGQNGVHVRLVGLEQFTELSLVSRGAANNPKIVGKSKSKLAAPTRALAARGFEVDRLFVTASKGEDNVNTEALLARIEEKTTAVATAEAQLSVANQTIEARDASIAELTGRVGELETELEAARAANENTEALEAAQAEAETAKTTLGEIYDRLASATDREGDKPEDVAGLSAAIEEMNSELTALIPAGGAGADTQNKDGDAGSKFTSRTARAFKAR